MAHLACQCLTYLLSDLLLGMQPWLDCDTLVSFPEPWQPRHGLFPEHVHTDIDMTLSSCQPAALYCGVYRHSFLGSMEVMEQGGQLLLKYGSLGNFCLHPNGVDHEFRLEGLNQLSILHKADLYSPSDWMLVHFNTVPDLDAPLSLCCSLFESGPEFIRL